MIPKKQGRWRTVVVEKAFDVWGFVACVLHGTPLRVDQAILRSRGHDLATVTQKKVALQAWHQSHNRPP